MAGPTDEEISRRLRGVAERVSALIAEEYGERMLIVLMIQPWGEPGQEDLKRGLQYISNGPREHVRGAIRQVLENWDAAPAMHVPPHKRN